MKKNGSDGARTLQGLIANKLDNPKDPVLKPAMKSFIDMVGEIGLAFSLVFTKTDKVKSNQMHSNVNKFRKELLKSWEFMPTYFLSSAIKKVGKDDILELIGRTNSEYRNG